MMTPVSEQRSRNMAAIRSKNTGLEMRVRRAIHAAGFRYRLHYRNLPGKPDLVFPKYRVVAFVHGCYWHGHICREARRPNSNLSYWTPKIEGNMARDRAVSERIEQMGWDVWTIRECTVESDIAALLDHLTELRKAA